MRKGITEESVRTEAGMQGKEVGKDRDQGRSVTDRFIFVRGIGFLFDSQFGVGLFKVVIISKNDVADNTKPVGKDGKLIGIAVMYICLASGGGSGMEGISA